MFFKSCRFAAIVLLLLSTPALAAVSIQYRLVPMGGNVYRYVYSITNTGSGSVQLFDIYFNTALYDESSLQIVSPANIQLAWSEKKLVSLPGVPVAYDALALQGGIPAGGSASGFSVQFTWIGSGTPGSQAFDIFNPTTFAKLESGTTAPEPASTVPLPPSLPLVMTGLGLAFAAAYQRRLRNRSPLSRI